MSAVQHGRGQPVEQPGRGLSCGTQGPLSLRLPVRQVLYGGLPHLSGCLSPSFVAMSDVSASPAPALRQPLPATLAAHAATTAHADAATVDASGPAALLILGTGGTIAGAAASAGSATGYQAGALPIGEILASVPGLAALVPDGRLASEQVFSIPSEQMDSAHWLQLLARVRAWQSASRAADAIVITHGTDTLEETAFFLSLVLPPDRPVILTGAMRPATALSADGPANLYDACRFALAARAAGIGGVFVQFAGKILRPDAVFKAHANQTDAFGQRFGAPVGWLEGDDEGTRTQGSARRR